MTEASRRRSVAGKMRTGTTSLGKNTSDYPECDENKVAVGSSQKPSEPRTRPRRSSKDFGCSRTLNSVRDQACQLFRSAQNENLLRGRSIEAIAAASVYGACRCNGLSRLVGEVSEMARVVESRVTNAYKTLNEELGLPAKPVSPGKFVPRLAPRTSNVQTRSDNGLEHLQNRPKRAVSRRASIQPGSQRPASTKRGGTGVLGDAKRRRGDRKRHANHSSDASRDVRGACSLTTHLYNKLP